MGSYTTNYSLYKPTPGSESTGWGALVNTGFDNIDSQVKANADAIAAGTAVIAKLKYYKTPTPATDGAETVFTTGAYVSGTLIVFRDQSVMIPGIDFDETVAASGTFTMTDAPDADEVLRVCYISA